MYNTVTDIDVQLEIKSSVWFHFGLYFMKFKNIKLLFINI